MTDMASLYTMLGTVRVIKPERHVTQTRCDELYMNTIFSISRYFFCLSISRSFLCLMFHSPPPPHPPTPPKPTWPCNLRNWTQYRSRRGSARTDGFCVFIFTRLHFQRGNCVYVSLGVKRCDRALGSGRLYAQNK